MPYVKPLRPDDPRRVGRYRITGRVDDLAIAEEGHRAVYRARNVSGDTVLVTLLSEDRASEPAARDRFTAEARSARRVPPFCVARILDAGLEGPYPYLVSEFIPGPSLADVISHAGPLPPDTVHALAVGCITGLAAIHQTGQVHGHLSPELIVISALGPRVVQFSITPPYGDATPAADVYDWAQTVLAAALGGAPSLPVTQEELDALPADLRILATDCLLPDPAERPSARAVLTELLGTGDVAVGMLAQGSRLARAAAQVPLPPERPQALGPQKSPDRSRVIALAGASAACVLALVITAFSIAKGGHTPEGVSTPAPTPVPTGHGIVPATFAGQWKGSVGLSGPPPAKRAVSVTLVAGQDGGTVSYPAQNCAGLLSVASATTSTLMLRQTITAGQPTCADGVIVLKLAKGKMISFSFYQTAPPLRTGAGQPVPASTVSHQ